jgi:hypothetical protein
MLLSGLNKMSRGRDCATAPFLGELGSEFVLSYVEGISFVFIVTTILKIIAEF